jgi:beta-glucosidase
MAWRQDRAAAASLALDASVDMDMVGGVYADDLKAVVSKDPARLRQLDEAVLRILRVKEQLGCSTSPCSTTTPNARPASCSRRITAKRRAPSRASRSCCSRTTANYCRSTPAGSAASP